jgi:hypothetical protein
MLNIRFPSPQTTLKQTKKALVIIRTNNENWLSKLVKILILIIYVTIKEINTPQSQQHPKTKITNSIKIFNLDKKI